MDDIDAARREFDRQERRGEYLDYLAYKEEQRAIESRFEREEW